MKREKLLLKNTIILGIGKIIPKLASLITLPIITYFLTKEEYGTYDLITTLVSLFLPVATLQMQAAAFRFLVNAKNDEEDVKSTITNIMVFTVIVSTIALTILYFTLYKLSLTLRLLILIYYFIDIYVETMRQITRGLSKNVIYSLSVLVNAIIELILIILFVVIFKNSLNGVLIAIIGGLFASGMYIGTSIKILKYINIKKVSGKKIKELISYAWPLIPNSLSSWVMQLSDRILITFFLGIEANAVYAVAHKLPNLFSIVQGTFNMAWQENACLAIEDSDSKVYYSKMFHIIFKMLVGIMALIIAFTPLLFMILIKGDYLESYNHIPILFMGAFFSAISSYIGGIYIAHKKSFQIGITTVIAAICNFVINILLIKHIGIYAASISTLVSYLLLAVYRMIDIQKIQKIKFNYSYIFVCILVLSGMCLICFKQNNILNIINVIIGITIALTLNKEMISVMLKKIRSKIR